MQFNGIPVILLGLVMTTASMQVCPNLQRAANFAVIGASTVTNEGLTVINGTSLTAFNPFGVVNGVTELGTDVAEQAQNDAITAYNYLQGLVPTVQMTGVDLAGKTLGPGVYKFNVAAAITTPAGVLTLSGAGVYIFQIGSTLVTSDDSKIMAINGAEYSCIFWQVGSSATLGQNSKFIGNILAYASIGLAVNVNYSGSLYARTGAVVLNADIITGSKRCNKCLSISGTIKRRDHSHRH